MSERYRAAVAVWAVSQSPTPSYWSKNRGHMEGTDKRDACRLDPDSVTSVEFVSKEGGGCETCSYTYMAAEFQASCICGKIKNGTFEINMSYGKDLSEIIAEVMACEPFTITEIAL